MSDPVDFWAIIGANPVQNRVDVETALARISQRLQAIATDDLRQFVAALRRCIFQLDRREFAEIQVELPGGKLYPQTGDHFLYARCACVLAGQVEYEHVLESRSGFEPFTNPNVQPAEALLYVAQEVYESKTGKRLIIDREVSIEWMSNPEGWGGESRRGSAH